MSTKVHVDICKYCHKVISEKSLVTVYNGKGDKVIAKMHRYCQVANRVLYTK